MVERTKREVKLLLFMCIEAKFATLHRDWQGLAWSNARTRGKVATFDVH